VNPNIAKVRAIWARSGIQNPKTATGADIASFEERYGVTMAPTVRDYFTVLNGTVNGKLGMDDENLTGFWHIDEVRRVNEECPQFAATEQDAALFVFADHSIWAHAYALRLKDGENSQTSVYFLGTGVPMQIAPTFDDFLSRYAANDQDLLFPRIDSTLI
jgi:hypothetical protein